MWIVNQRASRQEAPERQDQRKYFPGGWIQGNFRNRFRATPALTESSRPLNKPPQQGGHIVGDIQWVPGLSSGLSGILPLMPGLLHSCPERQINKNLAREAPGAPPEASGAQFPPHFGPRTARATSHSGFVSTIRRHPRLSKGCKQSCESWSLSHALRTVRHTTRPMFLCASKYFSCVVFVGVACWRSHRLRTDCCKGEDIDDTHDRRMYDLF